MGSDVRRSPGHFGVVPNLQRDFLLSLAIEGMYRPLWSSAILAELEYAESHKLMDRGEQPDVAATRASHLIDQMTAAFDDALVENWEPLEGHFRAVRSRRRTRRCRPVSWVEPAPSSPRT
jgi:hypothetical protein